MPGTVPSPFRTNDEMGVAGSDDRFQHRISYASDGKDDLRAIDRGFARFRVATGRLHVAVFSVGAHLPPLVRLSGCGECSLLFQLSDQGLVLWQQGVDGR